MSGLLQISDPHFGTEQPPVVEALARFVEAQRPELLVLSGDITQRATRAQFNAARRFVDRLAIPHRLVIPGNHDVPLYAFWMRLFAPYARHRAAFGDALEPTIETAGWAVIGVNTTRWYRHTDGEVSAEQIEQVAQQLQRSAGDASKLRIVVVHQPVAVTREKDAHDLLRGREAAVRRWAEAGADLVLGGHIHLPFVLPLQSVDGTLPRALWCVQAGTALSSRVRAGQANSVNLIRRDAPSQGRQCTVERWDFARSSGEFECAEIHTLALSAEAARAPARA
ncbi:MAG: metallophosphoesterase [Variovorax sp.]|nr:MAG: metallophosphoesterase [Variovorax sp.]